MSKVLIDRIVAHPNPIRGTIRAESLHELAESLKQHGQMTPIVLRYVEGRSTQKGTEYEIVIGFRRVEAAKLLGWLHIEAQVINALAEKMDLFNVVDNLQHEPLKDIELSQWLVSQPKLYKMPRVDLAKILGIDIFRLDQLIELSQASNQVKAVYLGSDWLRAKHYSMAKNLGYRKVPTFLREIEENKFSDSEIAHRLSEIKGGNRKKL